MRLTATCTMSFDVASPTPMILMLRPRSGLGQWVVAERYELTPFAPVVEYTDAHGNLCQRITALPGPLEIRTRVEAETADQIDVQPGAPFVPAQDLPPDALQFLLPSRYCESDKLGALAAEVAGDAAPGYDQAERICRWIHTQVAYRYGASDATTSAADTAQQRVGVCRDFAHLGMALCRALSIPARMVVGYLHRLDPMDLHAWFEAYVGGRWYTFDATQPEPRGGRIVIAYGRDAADVAMTTQFGPATLTAMQVSVSGENE
ncbi:transglutaminase family protein [Chloroflexia bacterium SDU3-3]|nr:transglutaminase family protein [Chloroflexia bacterium SDU3-3]